MRRTALSGCVLSLLLTAVHCGSTSPDPDGHWPYVAQSGPERDRVAFPGPDAVAASAPSVASAASPLAPQSSSVSASRWKYRGPKDLSGITASVAFDPANPAHLFAGGWSGMWESRDSGASWGVRLDFVGIGIRPITWDPNTPGVVYAGTWGTTPGTAGIYRSTDAGAHWSLLPSTPAYYSVGTIAIAPGNSDLLMASTRFGVIRSTDRGATWSVALAGVYWEGVVFFDPSNASNAIATTTTSDFHPHAHYSRDGGATWSEASGLPADLSSIGPVYAPSDPSTVYAQVYRGGDTSNGRLWKSTDGGASYSPLASTEPLMGGASLPAWVDPTDARVVVAAGVMHARTLDGGATVHRYDIYPPHMDFWSVVSPPGFNGTTNRQLFVSTDGGVFRTDDVYAESTGVDWTPLANGLGTTTYYDVDARADGAIVGAMQDTGMTLSLATSMGSTHLAEGDVVSTSFDPIDGIGLGASVGNLYRMPGAPLTLENIFHTTEFGAFENPFIFDPNDGHRIYFGVQSLFRTENAQATHPTWTTVRKPGSANITALAVQRGNPNVMWLAQEDGRIYKTTNALSVTPAWELIKTLDGYPRRIWIEPTDPSVVYVVNSRQIVGLVRTTDGGASWSPLMTTSNAPAFESAWAVTTHPDHPSWIYVGTKAGLLVSEDGGATWALAGTPIPNVDVRALKWIPGTRRLAVGTYGRGLWEIDLTPPERRRAIGR